MKVKTGVKAGDGQDQVRDRIKDPTDPDCGGC
jgi:hypothetical protein